MENLYAAIVEIFILKIIIKIIKIINIMQII